MANVTVYCANAFLLSLVLILAMAKVANRFGLVAMPSDIKTHDVRIPVVGAAMFVALCIASILLQRHPIGHAYLFLGLFLIVTLHEFGHALACRQVGGKADQIVLWPLGGVAYVAPPPRPGAPHTHIACPWHAIVRLKRSLRGARVVWPGQHPLNLRCIRFQPSA